MGASIIRYGMMGISSIVIPLLKKYFATKAMKHAEAKAKKSTTAAENYTSKVKNVE